MNPRCFLSDTDMSMTFPKSLFATHLLLYWTEICLVHGRWFHGGSYQTDTQTQTQTDIQTDRERDSLTWFQASLINSSSGKATALIKSAAL